MIQKSVTLLYLLFGFVEAQPAITMASVPSAIARSMQPAKTWPSMRSPGAPPPPSVRSFLPLMKARQNTQSLSASKSADHPEPPADTVSRTNQVEPSSTSLRQGRRNMVAAALAATAAKNQPAVAKEKEQVQVDAPPWALPVLAIGSVLTVLVPVVLSPGEEALEAQREAEAQVGVRFGNKKKR
eukprot:gnl/MRDRNA2_/MRDRNA2_161674_c0_seq1.p1 gnl/MRDRNA2_/MRDRNA2_161674_c0~~gnl/MRDRNA2_/MRDRNA2_161674_c0_seq1.p1  ORF type:complete len:184 (-),score=36.74 gnl/MRDRNA2_/MRDRNA2_161674_c0_seq1:202-753(-)